VKEQEVASSSLAAPTKSVVKRGGPGFESLPTGRQANTPTREQDL